jgi:hypothetical protein
MVALIPVESALKVKQAVAFLPLSRPESSVPPVRSPTRAPPQSRAASLIYWLVTEYRRTPGVRHMSLNTPKARPEPDETCRLWGLPNRLALRWTAEDADWCSGPDSARSI